MKRTIKPTINRIVIFVLLASLMSACTERIDITLDESYTRLVVDGAITTDTMQHSVKLTKTTSYFYNSPSPAVTGALVTVSDGTSITTLSETEPGVYKTPADYYGVPGRNYTLNIQLREPLSGFTDYEASSYMNQVTALDSIKAVEHPEWGSKGYVEIKCYVLDPPSTDFYMFKTYKNGALVTDTLSEVLVTDDRFYNGNYTNGIGVGFFDLSNPTQKVENGDILSLQSARITEEYYRFITQVQVQSGFQTPLFSGPPANIAGNINHDAIGFFAVYPVSLISTKYNGR